VSAFVKTVHFKINAKINGQIVVPMNLERGLDKRAVAKAEKNPAPDQGKRIREKGIDGGTDFIRSGAG
jgi:hypothetical protein